jgi:hypothetical protein
LTFIVVGSFFMGFAWREMRGFGNIFIFAGIYELGATAGDENLLNGFYLRKMK